MSGSTTSFGFLRRGLPSLLLAAVVVRAAEWSLALIGTGEVVFRLNRLPLRDAEWTAQGMFWVAEAVRLRDSIAPTWRSLALAILCFTLLQGLRSFEFLWSENERGVPLRALALRVTRFFALRGLFFLLSVVTLVAATALAARRGFWFDDSGTIRPLALVGCAALFSLLAGPFLYFYELWALALASGTGLFRGFFAAIGAFRARRLPARIGLVVLHALLISGGITCVALGTSSAEAAAEALLFTDAAVGLAWLRYLARCSRA